MDNNYFTNADNVPTPKIDLQQLTEQMVNLKTKFLHTFAGIPVRIDINLKDNQHYIAVSPSLHAELVANHIQYAEPADQPKQEQVCKWTKYHDGVYQTTCKAGYHTGEQYYGIMQMLSQVQQYKFCPYCGRRIEVNNG